MPVNPQDAFRRIVSARRRLAELGYDGDIFAALNALDFYRRRCEAIQTYQRHLPEPHRTVICNILANGKPHP